MDRDCYVTKEECEACAHHEKITHYNEFWCSKRDNFKSIKFKNLVCQDFVRGK